MRTLKLSLFFILSGCLDFSRSPTALDNLKKIYSSYQLTPTKDYSTMGIRVRDLVGEKNHTSLKLSLTVNLDFPKAQNIMQSAQSTLQALHSTKPNPYFDVISQTKQCPLANQVQWTTSDSLIQYELSATLFANERFVVGMCDPSQVAYNVSFRYLYCRKLNILLVMKMFIPKDQTANFSEINSLQCSLLQN